MLNRHHTLQTSIHKVLIAITVQEDCPSENNTESSSADPTAISSDPPVDPPDAEESTPSTEDEDCIDFEPFGDDFEDEDALEVHAVHSNNATCTSPFRE